VSLEGALLGALFTLAGVLGVADGARSWYPAVASRHDAMLDYLLVTTGGLFLMGRQLVAAFRSGILFLLAAPFASCAVVGFLAVRAQRQAERRRPCHGKAEAKQGGG
jgi:hypothetical protein